MKHKISDGFPYYIECVGNNDYKQVFKSKQYIKLLGTLTEDQSTYRYADGKWSIKQIIGHITDHERIMMYRALCFSRKDKTLLPGYEQNLYVENSRFNEQPFSQLLTDLDNVRNASLSFIESLSPEQLLLTGKAWKFELTIEEFLKATIGHEMHHLDIIKQRYLI
ncbi:DinB family protein [Thalassobellus citreus]|uniref:DinB family protein n=1 Tax=Thalassobellus citreus TaxID=3367752 RepID=UPI0037AB6FC9